MLVRNLKGKLFHPLRISSQVYQTPKALFSEKMRLKERIKDRDQIESVDRTQKNLNFVD